MRVQHHGRRFRRRHLLLLVAPRDTRDNHAARIGFTVSRKVGNAVIRNRVRRRLREIARANGSILCDNFDYVVVGSPPAATATFATLREDLTSLLKRARDEISRKGS